MLDTKRYKSIVEELHAHRSGRILESVTKSVTTAVDRFYKEQKTPSQIKKRINNLLNFIYLKCNELGKNNFVGGSHDFVRGDFQDYGDAESGPDLKLFPSIYELDFEIRFVDKRMDFNKVYYEVSSVLQKDAKSNYKDYEQDAFSINIAIDGKLDEMYGYGMSIEKSSAGLKIILFNQVDPFLTEGVSSVRKVKYFKGQKPWDNFKFEFIPWHDLKNDKYFLKVNMRNEYWDSGDYAFIDVENPEVTNIHSYSDVASNTVLKALKAAGYTKNELERIIKDLKIAVNEANEAPLDIENTPYIKKRKTPEEVEDDNDKKDAEAEKKIREKQKKREENKKETEDITKSSSDTDNGELMDLEDDEEDEENPEESGVFGKEIGLPIDKENCESTDISGVATPTGKLNPRKKVLEGMDSSDTIDMTIECPECGSQNVNIRDAVVFHCAECGYEWKVSYDKEEEKALMRDTMLDNTNDETPLAYKRYTNSRNNIYVSPSLNEDVVSASDLEGDLYDAVSSAGEITYNGSDFIEVEADKRLVDNMEKYFKKKRYKVSKAGNRLSVDGGDEFHYIEVQVKPKVGSKGTYIVSYDIPI